MFSRSIPHASGDEPTFVQGIFPAHVVYPTRVGMNRRACSIRFQRARIPHASGDELNAAFCLNTNDFVYPTRVGMNQYLEKVKQDIAGIPHASGDEPKIDGFKYDKSYAYTPREWG